MRCECGYVRSLHIMSVLDIMLIVGLLYRCRRAISISAEVWVMYVGCISHVDYDFITPR